MAYQEILIELFYKSNLQNQNQVLH